jgi:hypothetical protein
MAGVTMLFGTPLMNGGRTTDESESKEEEHIRY